MSLRWSEQLSSCASDIEFALTKQSDQIIKLIPKRENRFPVFTEALGYFQSVRFTDRPQRRCWEKPDSRRFTSGYHLIAAPRRY